MDDPARRVERGVLGGGPRGGVAGSVSRGLVCQQALLPEEGQGQVPVVVPAQLCGQVICAPSEQLEPAAAQQDLVLEGRPRAASWLLRRPWPGAGEGGAALRADRRLAVVFQSNLRSMEARGPKLGCLLGKAIILEATFKNQVLQNLRRNDPSFFSGNCKPVLLSLTDV